MPEERIVALLYMLMRDEVPTGVMARLVRDIEEHADRKFVFTAKPIEEYARELCQRLTRPELASYSHNNPSPQSQREGGQ